MNPNIRGRGLLAGRPGIFRDSLTGYALRAATAAALVIDAVVHLQDAYFYDANTGTLLSQGQLFRVQAGVAIATAVLVLAWPRRPAWALAALVMLSAAAAVVTYTYVNIGPIAGLPNMHEPSWGPPGKLASAFAEGAGGLIALAGLAMAMARQRRLAREAAGEPARTAGQPMPARPSA